MQHDYRAYRKGLQRASTVWFTVSIIVLGVLIFTEFIIQPSTTTMRTVIALGLPVLLGSLGTALCYMFRAPRVVPFIFPIVAIAIVYYLVTGSAPTTIVVPPHN